jgi:hypothetical protein
VADHGDLAAVNEALRAERDLNEHVHHQVSSQKSCVSARLRLRLRLTHPPIRVHMMSSRC